MDTGFDTRQRGTPDEEWRAILDDVPTWVPPSSPLVVLAPHPDDETLGAGGLIHHYANSGREVTIVVVTDGEKARPEIPDLVTRRAAELRQAVAHLAPHARIVRLGLPDGDVASCKSQLARHLHGLVPHDALLVAPCEFDGHSDHDTTGEVALAVARKLSLACIRYPIWAWHRLHPRDGLVDSNSIRLSLTSEALHAKRLAMDCYVSQLEERPGGAIVPAHVLRHFQHPYEVYLT